MKSTLQADLAWLVVDWYEDTAMKFSWEIPKHNVTINTQEKSAAGRNTFLLEWKFPQSYNGEWE